MHSLYTYVAKELLQLSSCYAPATKDQPILLFGSEVRRVSTVLQVLHALKHHFCYGGDGDVTLVRAVRQQQLLFLKQLLTSQDAGVLEDECTALLNYLASAGQATANLLDVLELVNALLAEAPASMVPAFDAKNGIRVLFTLVARSVQPSTAACAAAADSAAHKHELRLLSLRVLASFLSRSTAKRKQDTMSPANLFMLLAELLAKTGPLDAQLYGALMEVAMEAPLGALRRGDAASLRLENPMLVKVIAVLDKPPAVKRAFLKDLWRLLVASRDNRRLLLQMSVWQQWLIALLDDEHSAEVLALFKLLLYHALRWGE